MKSIDQIICAFFNFRRCAGDRSMRWKFINGGATRKGFKGCFEGCKAKLVSSQRTIQRMTPHAFNGRSPTDDAAGLWPAQQFVAAKRNDVGAGFDGCANHRLAFDSVSAKIY